MKDEEPCTDTGDGAPCSKGGDGHPCSKERAEKDETLCDCVDKLEFIVGHNGSTDTVELRGLNVDMLKGTALKDIKLNFNGKLVDVWKIHPDRCSVEFVLPADVLNEEKDIEVGVLAKGESKHHVDFVFRNVVGSNVVGVTHLDNEEEMEAEEMNSLASRQERFLARLRGEGRPNHILFEQCVAEFFGVAFIAIFGVGVVCTATLTGAQAGVFQVAVVWGFGVSFAIYSTASISGAHLNPAVSLAFAIFRPHQFPWNRLLPFWVAQVLGGMFGGAMNLAIFHRWLDRLDPDKSTVLGASIFGEYFPNPSIFGTEYNLISAAECMFVEAWGTGLLMFMILALTDSRNKALQNKDAAPFFIGFTVASLISLYGPLQQAGWNPARDFGPRLVALMAGYGSIAIPGPRYGFWAYIVGPLIGAPIGAFVYDVILARGLRGT